MNKLSKKFTLGIAVILLTTITASLLINSNVVERYYLHEKKASIDEICERLTARAQGEGGIEEAAAYIEQSEEVTVVWTPNTGDNDKLNEQLRAALMEKGIGFQKFWLWDQDYQSVMENGKQLRVYNQGKLNYSILVEYLENGQNLCAVAMIIPHIEDAIGIINTATGFVMICALIVALILVMVLVKRITRPLDKMKRFAEDIAARDFHSIDINTNDELQTVADSMNQMCSELQIYQDELLNKNRQMEQLMDNVAHDLKTPIALVQAYAGGLRDGLDDGTFLDTVIRQNERMGEMVENLLYLSRVKKAVHKREALALDRMLEALLEEQSILAERRGAAFESDICEDAMIESDSETLALILTNLLSNAIKYSSGNVISVSLKKADEVYVFAVSNDTDTSPDISRLWEPFYVGEASRNKELSGTGLGLALVKSGAEKLGYDVSCDMSEGVITFKVFFKL